MAGIKRIDGVYCGHPKRHRAIRIVERSNTNYYCAIKTVLHCSLCNQDIGKPSYTTAIHGGKTITTPVPAYAVHEYLERQKHASNRHSSRGRQRQT